MIRPLTNADRELVVPFLSSSPEINLYLLGNVETPGFEESYCQFWGDFEAKTGRLRAVLNRYMTGWVVFGEADADWPALGRILDEYPETAKRLQDNPMGIESFLPFLRRYRASKLSVQELMALDAADFHPVAPRSGVVIRRAVWEDLPQLVAVYADAEHMTRTPAAVEIPLRDRRIWLAEQGGAVVSVALTNAETAGMAMIGGVFTLPHARGQGLSQAVCSGLCAELLALGKRPVLYWENKAAGTVYRKLGFHPIGAWRSVHLELVPMREEGGEE